MLSSSATRSAWFLCAAALVVASASGCNCHPTQISKNSGEIGVVWRDADGNRVVNRDATYDFGYALVGDKKPLTLTIRNTGAGKLTLSKLELASGSATAIGPAGDADFQVEFAAQGLDPSGQAEYQMYFTPRGLKGDYLAVLTLSTEGARTEDSTATITLKGSGEKGSCDLPSVIDFGKVPVGETLPYPVTFANPTNVDAIGLADAITGADATSFGYAPTSPHGDVPVTRQTSVEVAVTFSPTEKRAYSAQVTMHGAGGCPDVNVTIKGEGSDDVFSWAPDHLEYGFVSPGFDSVKDVLFKNESSTPITLTEVTSSLPTDFSHRVVAGVSDKTLTVPGNSAAFPMHLACSPAGMGPRTGTVTFKTPLKKTPTGTITLKCTGGGPKIKVTPRPTLAFGRVAFFPGTASFNVTRKVHVQNVGSDPVLGLFLGQVDGSGTPGQLPLIEINPTNANTDPSEFVAALASAYDPVTGIQIVAGHNYVDVGVTLTPKTIGLKEAELIIYSNDSAEPVVKVTITADVQQRPPCNYTVTPGQANFGLVTPPNSKDLPVTITNLGTAPTDLCYISGVDLAPGTNPAYSIVGGPVVEKELQPSEAWQVVVRVAPPGPVPTSIQSLTGVMTFNASSPTKPQGVVPLSTAVGPVCLVVTPDPLDFGTVKVGCNSRDGNFSIYNVCNAPVTITGVTMQAAGGQPAGGPNCPAGGAACPEFRVVGAAISFPSVVQPGAAPVPFHAKYTPIDIGSDQGAVSIAAMQGGQSLTYLVGLQGTGDATGQQTDTFVQAQKPQADILLVVDDSGSMQDKQTNLANNFASFIQYAVSAGVDYHVGVITTSADEQTCPPAGIGLPCASTKGGGIMNRKGSGATRVGPVLTPSSPNLSAAFADLVKVGIDGSGSEQGLETAVLALTPPRIAADNAGFLRPDANLAVVIISDAADQSPQPVSYYQNRLINVKGFNRLSMFTFSDIGPYNRPIAGQPPVAPNFCSYDESVEPNRYDLVVAATGGIKDEICTTNWSGALQNLGRTAFGYRTQFFLNNVPDTTNGKTPIVKVNGQVVTQSTTTWSYEGPPTNAIKFESTATPGPGQTLTVTYTNTCF